MRGCFPNANLKALRPFAFPAYAGMFLPYINPCPYARGFPRVCGDVSYCLSFSWSKDKAFPAYAGMFPGFLTDPFFPKRFPRVCGDVSWQKFNGEQKNPAFPAYAGMFPSNISRSLEIDWLSPRMRGCFHLERSSQRKQAAFPAYAGMFLVMTLTATNQTGFPRVCGDVSRCIASSTRTSRLSPRMRGCFRYL